MNIWLDVDKVKKVKYVNMGPSGVVAEIPTNLKVLDLNGEFKTLCTRVVIKEGKIRTVLSSSSKDAEVGRKIIWIWYVLYGEKLVITIQHNEKSKPTFVKKICK